MTALEYFRLLAPEFVAVGDPIVTSWLTIAGNLVYAPCLDAERLAMAHALYAAHLQYMAGQSASGGGGSVSTGALIREKEGDLERAYSASSSSGSSSNSELAGSLYGRQYLDLTRACHGAAIMTRYCR